MLLVETKSVGDVFVFFNCNLLGMAESSLSKPCLHSENKTRERPVTHTSQALNNFLVYKM